VDEDPIVSYSVYFVDGCGLPMGDPVATVPKQSGVYDTSLPSHNWCCQNDAYRAEVIERIPPGSGRFVIVPVTSTGPLSVGELTDFINDFVVNDTDAIAITNGGMTSALPSWRLVSVTFVAAASLLASREH